MFQREAGRTARSGPVQTRRAFGRVPQRSQGIGGYGEGALRDAYRAWFPITGLRGCVTIIDNPPGNARCAGAREARRLRAYRLAVGTRSKLALRGEVRTAVTASRR